MLKSFYPRVADFKISKVQGGGKKLEVIETFGNYKLETEATHLNDGLLRMLAILAQSASGHSLVLLDEIENGINQEVIEKLVDTLVASPQQLVVTTHSPLFYNVLFNELNGKTCYMLDRFEDGSFALTEKPGDSNKSFSYHLHLKRTIEQAIADNKIEKYHFTLLRNLYEKTASFLGYPKWSELLPDDKQLYLSRIINFTSHSTLSNETVAEPTQAEKATVKLLLDHLKSNYGFWHQEEQNG
jgi:ABC-type multidrug transport system ATPase subunit